MLLRRALPVLVVFAMVSLGCDGGGSSGGGAATTGPSTTELEPNGSIAEVTAARPFAGASLTDTGRSRNGDVDLFAYDFEVPTNVRVALAPPSNADLQLELLSASGASLGVSTNPPGASELLTLSGFSGRLYARVFPATGAGSDDIYALSVDGVAIGAGAVSEVEPNDSPVSAGAVGILSGGTQTLTGALLHSTDEDLWRAELSAATDVTVTLALPAGVDGGLEIQDGGGAVLGQANAGGIGVTESVTVSGVSGSLFARVSFEGGAASAQAYTLSFATSGGGGTSGGTTGGTSGGTSGGTTGGSTGGASGGSTGGASGGGTTGGTTGGSTGGGSLTTLAESEPNDDAASADGPLLFKGAALLLTGSLDAGDADHFAVTAEVSMDLEFRAPQSGGADLVFEALQSNGTVIAASDRASGEDEILRLRSTTGDVILRVTVGAGPAPQAYQITVSGQVSGGRPVTEVEPNDTTNEATDAGTYDLESPHLIGVLAGSGDVDWHAVGFTGTVDLAVIVRPALGQVLTLDLRSSAGSMLGLVTSSSAGATTALSLASFSGRLLIGVRDPSGSPSSDAYEIDVSARTRVSAPRSQSATLDSAGGAVQISAGASPGISVTVAAGALVAPSQITISEQTLLPLAGFTPVGPCFTVDASAGGQSAAATVALGYSNAELPPGHHHAGVVLLQRFGAGPVTVADASLVDPLAQTVTAPVAGLGVTVQAAIETTAQLVALDELEVVSTTPSTSNQTVEQGPPLAEKPRPLVYDSDNDRMLSFGDNRLELLDVQTGAHSPWRLLPLYRARAAARIGTTRKILMVHGIDSQNIAIYDIDTAELSWLGFGVAPSVQGRLAILSLAWDAVAQEMLAVSNVNGVYTLFRIPNLPSAGVGFLGQNTGGDPLVVPTLDFEEIGPCGEAAGITFQPGTNTLLGISVLTGELFEVDPSSGTTTLLGQPTAGIPTYAPTDGGPAFEFKSDPGVVYTRLPDRPLEEIDLATMALRSPPSNSTFFRLGQGRLGFGISIDPSTGRRVFVHVATALYQVQENFDLQVDRIFGDLINLGDLFAIAYHRQTGRLYGVTNSDRFIEVNLNDGTHTVIATTGLGISDCRGMDIEEGMNRAIVLDGAGQLVAVDVTSGAASVLAQVSSDFSGLALDPNGTCWTMDLSDGSLASFPLSNPGAVSRVGRGIPPALHQGRLCIDKQGRLCAGTGYIDQAKGEWLGFDFERVYESVAWHTPSRAVLAVSRDGFTNRRYLVELKPRRRLVRSLARLTSSGGADPLVGEPWIACNADTGEVFILDSDSTGARYYSVDRASGVMTLIATLPAPQRAACAYPTLAIDPAKGVAYTLDSSTNTSGGVETNLVRIDSAGNPTNLGVLTGLRSGELAAFGLRAMIFDPLTRRLYGLLDDEKSCMEVYLIDPDTRQISHFGPIYNLPGQHFQRRYVLLR